MSVSSVVKALFCGAAVRFITGCIFKSMFSFNNAPRIHKPFSPRKHRGQWRTHSFCTVAYQWTYFVGSFCSCFEFDVSIEMCPSDVESKSGMRGQKGFFRHSITRTVHTHFKDFTIPLCLHFYVSFSFAYEIRLNLYLLSFSLCHSLSNNKFLWNSLHQGQNNYLSTEIIIIIYLIFFVRFVSLTKNIALGHVHTPYFDVFTFFF